MTAVRQPEKPSRSIGQQFLSFSRDARFLAVIGQIVFVIVVAILASGLFAQISASLRASNTTPTFGFLSARAGFGIANAGDYTPDDTYWEAFAVGIRNTLSVVSIALVGATLLGIVWGVLLLSTNWLLRTVTRTLVEILRNVPLLIVIVIVYFAVLTLPVQRDAISFPAAAILPIPIRYFIYAVAALIVWNIMRGLPAAQHHQRALIVSAFVVTLVVIEMLFVLYGALPGAMSIIYGGALTSNFGQMATAAGIIIALLTFIGAKNTPQAVRGALTGVLIGGLLFFFGVVPSSALRLETSPILYISNRGLVYPNIMPTARFAEWAVFVVIGIVIAVVLYLYLGRVQEKTGQPQPRLLYSVLITLGLALIGWIIVSAQPLPAAIPVADDNGIVSLMSIDDARTAELLTADDELLYASDPLGISIPARQGLRFVGGVEVSENYVALLIALVIYTAAFIAEIVRAGILAVPKGQIEAARSLGLGYGQMLRMVILPQALRVIIPPLGNQYLNLAKNSSLAIAIAYADLYAVTYTMINQSGQSVTGIFMLMVVYLIISLSISAVMNWVNGRFEIKTR